MAKMKDVINEILRMVGQDRIYTECGGDFPACGAKSSHECRDFADCHRQLVRVRQTAEIRQMLGEAEE